ASPHSPEKELESPTAKFEVGKGEQKIAVHPEQLMALTGQVEKAPSKKPKRELPQSHVLKQAANKMNLDQTLLDSATVVALQAEKRLKQERRKDTDGYSTEDQAKPAKFLTDMQQPAGIAGKVGEVDATAMSEPAPPAMEDAAIASAKEDQHEDGAQDQQ
ncbi:unnamed protein product, partial [Prorocentrum cordatum]